MGFYAFRATTHLQPPMHFTDSEWGSSKDKTSLDTERYQFPTGDQQQTPPPKTSLSGAQQREGDKMAHQEVKEGLGKGAVRDIIRQACPAKSPLTIQWLPVTFCAWSSNWRWTKLLCKVLVETKFDYGKQKKKNKKAISLCAKTTELFLKTDRAFLLKMHMQIAHGYRHTRADQSKHTWICTPSTQIHTDRQVCTLQEQPCVCMHTHRQPCACTGTHLQNHEHSYIHTTCARMCLKRTTVHGIFTPVAGPWVPKGGKSSYSSQWPQGSTRELE